MNLHRIVWTREFIHTVKGLRNIMVGRRRGRKRRVVLREPNGRQQRVPTTSPEAIAASMPHRKGLKAELRLDHRAESAIGRRLLMGQITEVEYEAGIRWRELVHRYARVIDAPMPSPRSPAGALLGSSGGGGELVAAEAERIRGAYNAAHDHLHQHAGHRGMRAVSHCAVYDRDPDMKYLVVGLQALADHFRLTPTRKSETVRNRRCDTAS